MDESLLLRRVWLCYQFCETIPYPMCVVEADSGTVTYANQSFQKTLGTGSTPKPGDSLWAIDPPLTTKSQWKRLVDELTTSGSVSYPAHTAMNREGSRPFLIHASHHRDEDGEYVFVIFGPPSTLTDDSIGDARDELTGCVTRSVLQHQLQQTLREQSRSDHPFAILFMDLDHFKRINDQFGHTTGDAVLRETAKRIRQQIRPGDLVSRYGGDEFVLLIRDLRASDDISTVVTRLVDGVQSPLTIDSHRISVSVSVGVRIVDASNVSSKQLLRQADEAMYAAKEDSERSVRYFDDNLRDTVRRRIRLRESFPDALAAGEFALWGQPIVELDTGQTIGVEVLLRWDRGEEDPLDAGSFLPVFEQSQEMVQLDRWVLEHVATHRSTAETPSEPGTNSALRSVNVSRLSLLQDHGSGDLNPFKLTRSDHPAQCVLDLPASVFRTESPERIDRILQRIPNSLTSLAVDGVDVRTPLLALETKRIDFLKIHRSVVRDLTHPSNRRFLCRLMRYVSDKALQVVGVGIENEEQFHTLRGLGCEYGQGFFFGRPEPLNGETSES